MLRLVLRRFAVLFRVLLAAFVLLSGMLGVLAMTGTVRAVGFVKLLHLIPIMTLAGHGAKEKSGGCGGEERGQFHAAPGVGPSPGDGKRQGKRKKANRLPFHFDVQCWTFDVRCSSQIHLAIAPAALK